MSFEQFISRRYIRSKRKQAFISLITILSIAGVTVGVMALIVVIAVMSGAMSDLKARILGIESHVVVMRYGNSLTDYENIMSTIGNIDGVEKVSPFIYTQIMLRSSAGVSGAVLKGIEPSMAVQEIKQFDNISLKARLTTVNEADKAGSTPGIILGKELAANLGVLEGDLIYLISPKGMVSPIGHVPAMRRYKVTGVFETGLFEYDGSLAYVHIESAQKLLRMPKAVTGVELRVKDIYNAGHIADEIVSALGYPYWARDWMKMNKNLFSALKLEKTALFVILTLIVLVAAFNIASTLIMMVMEKTKDIAILKAMGATDRSIKKIFIYKGMAIGSVGTFLGVVLGFVLCTLLKHYKFIELPGDVYYFTTLPVKLESLDVIVIASAALLICFVASLYPAHQASKLNPVEAIRYG